MIIIKTLLEDTMSENEALENEHGLSFYIEGEKEGYLFDCGSSDRFIKNAYKMGIDLFTVKTVICSHSHFDHSLGIKFLLEKDRIKELITGKGFLEAKYSTDGIKYTYLGCGFDDEYLFENGIVHKVCEDIYEIEKGIYLIGNFERIYEFEKIGNEYLKERAEEFIKDSFEDEICLVIDGKEGLTVLCGCSHPGILNMLSTVKKRLNKEIYAMYGGVHLKNATDERCYKVIEELKKLGIKILGFSHCSGEKITKLAEKEFNTTRLSCGDEIRIER